MSRQKITSVIDARASALTDRELVIEAIHKAGSQKALAKVFGVAQPAISLWGRARPIPRHVKPRLEEYVKSISAVPTDERPAASPMRDLLKLLGSTAASGRLAGLPPRYRRRYEERVAEAIARLKRELEEYQAVLEAEHRSASSPRRGSPQGAGS